MKKHQRDQRGRTLNWRRTKYGKHHGAKRAKVLFLRDCMAYGIAATSAAQLAVIQATPATTPEARAKKALAIAQTIIDANLAQIGVSAKFMGKAN